jgi:parvulin-like peptidyl-prolyl isomerase
VALFTVFIAAGVFAQTSMQNQQTVATVNLAKSEIITVGDLRAEVDKYEKGLGRPLTDKDRRDLLDTMINERLVKQAAERDKIVVTDNEIEQQIQQLKSMLVQQLGRQPTDAEFAQAVKNEYDLDMASFRSEMRKMAVMQRYLMSKKEALFKSLKEPTEAEIKKFFEDNQAQMFTRPQTVKLSALQIVYGADKFKAKEQADKLAKDIGSNGDKFDEIAMKGKLPNSAYKSSDDFYLPRDDQGREAVGNEFFDAVFALKRGDISKVISGNEGYYLAKIVNIYPPIVMSMDDIYRLGFPVSVHDYIGMALSRQREQDVLKKATEELVADLRAGGKTFRIFENNLKW